jgi:hypothetical protein
MPEPEASPGIFILFQRCNEHIAPDDSIKFLQGKISSSVISSPTAAICSHIHCLECGCIKSRAKCVYAEPRKDVMGSPVPFPHPSYLSPDGLSQVEVSGPELVEFKLRWSYSDERDCWIEGVLPTQMASSVINTVNHPTVLKNV